MANKNLNKFEATMMAIQKSKNESVKRTSKKGTKRNLTESRRVNKRRKLKESDEFEIEDTYEEEMADDIVDDVVVVVDPEMDTDDYEAVIGEFQDIVDSTPEGEVPFTDEYIGDEIYACPICGNAFFGEIDLHGEGEVCPVCGETPEGFVEVGSVESTDEDMDGEIEADEDLDPDNDGDVDEEIELDIDTDEMEEVEETYSPYELDENTINPLLTSFIKENYKNAVNMRVRKAYVNGSRLRLECSIRMKSGKVKKTNVVIENFRPNIKGMKLNAKLDKSFKSESRGRKPDIVFSAKLTGRKVKIESMKYDFITVKEGTKLQIYGNKAVILEGRNKLKSNSRRRYTRR